MSGYAVFNNNPIALNDPDGDKPDCPDCEEVLSEVTVTGKAMTSAQAEAYDKAEEKKNYDALPWTDKAMMGIAGIGSWLKQNVNIGVNEGSPPPEWVKKHPAVRLAEDVTKLTIGEDFNGDKVGALERFGALANIITMFAPASKSGSGGPVVKNNRRIRPGDDGDDGSFIPPVVKTDKKIFKNWVSNNLTSTDNPLTDSEARELLNEADKLGLLHNNHGRWTLEAETHGRSASGSGYYDNVPHIHIFGEHIPVLNPNFKY